MKAALKKREEIASGTLLLVFDLLGRDLEFKPGEFFFVELIDPPYRDEEGGRRHFSFVNSPTEKGIAVMATRSRDSAFKRSLADMPLGSTVEIDYTGGGDFVLPDDDTRPLVFLAGGIGITPFISMIRYVKAEGLHYRMTLIYSNRDEGSAAFLDELRDHAGGNDGLELILTMTKDPAWDGETRKMDAEFISEYVEDTRSSFFFLAGPPAMNKAIASELSKLGVARANVKVSDFAGY